MEILKSKLRESCKHSR